MSRRPLLIGVMSATLLLACYHTGVVALAPPPMGPGLASGPVPLATIKVASDIVADVAAELGFQKQFPPAHQLVPNRLLQYANPDQVSLSLWIAEDSTALLFKIRDPHHGSETPLTRSIRSAIEAKVRARLPDHRLSYTAERDLRLLGP